MNGNLDIHIGGGFDEAASRVLDAVNRAKRGETVGESHLTFESWEGLSKVLTGRRLELLRHLHRNPAASVAQLARDLGRDYKRVHEDVEHLERAGLITRPEEGGLTAEYDEIRTKIAM
ncbi:MAG: MarR family transcriptional regulator [Gammaproteobacteria bacterium]|nr:MarR family transcriptional regulator [Gammaproteobacteria bacterium]